MHRCWKHLLIILQFLIAAVGMAPAHSQVATFTKTDIGSPGVAGTYSYGSGTYTVAGAGTGISGTADSFTFASTPASGPVEMIARVATQTGTPLNNYAQAGLMVRDSLNAAGVHAFVSVSPQNGVNFTTRTTTGASSSTTLGPSIAVPVWLRIVLSQSSIATYYGTDGINWTLVGKTTITMPTIYQVGFAVSSNINNTLSMATFTNVSLLTSVPQRSPNLLLWLRSDVGLQYDGSNNILAWQDQSGNGNNCTGTSPNQPTLVTAANGINGLPALKFDVSGSNGQWLSLGPGFASMPGLTAFVVMQPNTVNANARIFSFGNGIFGSGSNDFGFYFPTTGSTALRLFNYNGGSLGSLNAPNALTIGTPELIEGVQDGAGNATIYQNGISQASGSLSNINTVSSRVNNFIGKNPTSTTAANLQAVIAEILVFNKPLSTAERQSVENYLIAKFSLGGTPPALTAPTITPQYKVSATPQTVTMSPPPGSIVYYTTDGSTPTPSSTAYTAQFTVSSTSTIKAIAVQPGFATSPVASGYIQIDSNASAVLQPGLQIWLRADNGVITSGSSVTQWNDVSANGNNFSQSTSTKQPQLSSNQINGLPAVSFNGTSHYVINNSNFQTWSGATFFLVMNPTGSAPSDQRIIEFGPGSNSNLLGLWIHQLNNPRLVVYSGATASNVTATGGLSTGYQLFDATDISVTGTLYRNGVQTAVSTSLQTIPSASRTSNCVGASTSASAFYQGYVAELIVYNQYLSTTQRKTVEAYLAARYALPINPNPPTISPSTGVYPVPSQTVTITGDAGTQLYYTLDGQPPVVGNADTFLYSGPFTLSSSGTVQAIAVRPGGTSSTSVAGIVIDPTAGDVPLSGMLLWLRSDAGLVLSGTGAPPPVSRWTDLSGSANDATTTASYKPTLVPNVVNGLPAVTYGTSMPTSLPLPSGFSNFSQGASIFSAIQGPTQYLPSATYLVTLAVAADNNALYMVPSVDSFGRQLAQLVVSDVNGNSTGATGYTGFTPSTPWLAEAVHNGAGTATLYANGVQIAQNTAMQNIANVTRDNNAAGFAGAGVNFHMCELLLYNRAVTVTERKNIETYLMHRYSFTGPISAPVFSVQTGTTFGGPQQVAISSPPNATIYFTTDGNTPTISSPVYAGPITVSYSQTIQAMAVVNGVQSAVSSASYTLDATKWPAPSSGGTTAPVINLQLPTPAQ